MAGEHHAPCGQTVDVARPEPRKNVRGRQRAEAHVAVAEVVGEDEYDVRAPVFRRRRPAGGQDNGKNQQLYLPCHGKKYSKPGRDATEVASGVGRQAAGGLRALGRFGIILPFRLRMYGKCDFGV